MASYLQEMNLRDPLRASAVTNAYHAIIAWFKVAASAQAWVWADPKVASRIEAHTPSVARQRVSAQITAVVIATSAVDRTTVGALFAWVTANTIAVAVLASAAAARKKEVAVAASAVVQTAVGALVA